MPFPAFKILSEASSNHARGASHSPLGSLIQRTQSASGRYGLPCKKAVVMSAVNGNMPSTVQTAITMLRESLVKVGAVALSLPDRASGSLNPCATNLAFALGDPSGCFFHCKMKWALSTLFSSELLASSMNHTLWSKKDASSLVFASRKARRSDALMQRSERFCGPPASCK